MAFTVVREENVYSRYIKVRANILSMCSLPGMRRSLAGCEPSGSVPVRQGGGVGRRWVVVQLFCDCLAVQYSTGSHVFLF